MLLRNSQLRWGMLVRNSSGRGPMVVRNDTEGFRGVIGAQGRNRTTDTGIFSPFKFLGKNPFLSGDVRQAPAKTRQRRYAEARSCTVAQDLARQKPRLPTTSRAN